MITWEWVPRPSMVAKGYYDAAGFLMQSSVPTQLSHEVIKDEIQENFDSQGAGVGGWAPLKPDYLKQKVRQGYPADILRRTGELEDSVQNDGSYDVDIFPGGATIAWTGAASPSYWIYHHTGTSKMPPRPFVGISEEGVVQIERIWDDFMDQAAAVWAGGGGGIGPGHRFEPRAPLYGGGFATRGPGGRFVKV